MGRRARDGAALPGSGEQFVDYFAGDVGEAEIAALEAVSQFGVIEAKQFEQGGVEIMDMDLIGGGVEPEFVRFAQGDARFDTATGHPHGEAIGMMIAAIISALDHGSAAEFAAPHNQRIVEHAALLEVLDQGCAGLVGVATVFL
jgi:hypothetical protein